MILLGMGFTGTVRSNACSLNVTKIRYLTYVSERRPPLERWGGVECTVNRVGDAYRDQLALTGHDRRDADLDALADLGLAALRYPVLWERVAPDAPPGTPGACDWRWSDRRLARLQDMAIRPIVGLVHHGSGPRYTALVDDSFAPGRSARSIPMRDWSRPRI